MDFSSVLFLYIIIILSAVLHEYAHAWAAFRQGDLTAKYAGRLTLNPLAHIDWWGTVLMPLLLLYYFKVFFGYAKPVPVNPYNFRDQRRGMIEVSLAGVATNFLTATSLGLIVRFLPDFILRDFLAAVVSVNIWLGVFNLLPVPPLDGSKLLMALADLRPASRLGRWLEFLGTPWGSIVSILILLQFLPYLGRLNAWIFGLIVGG